MQVENHYLWIDDSELNNTAEVMSSLNLIVFFFCELGGAVAVMYNSEKELVRLMLTI